MSFLRAARAARVGWDGTLRICASAAVILLPAMIFLSCSSSGTSSKVAANHAAYVSLPDDGSLLLLQMNGTTGAVVPETQTPQIQGTSPTGLALLPSKQFLYAANSRANTISTYSVGVDNNLYLVGSQPAGDGPNVAVIDPSGGYLLVTNNFSNNISVFSIDSSTGALTEVSGSPYNANSNPTDIYFTHTGQFVYVTNPGIKMVTGFAFCPPALASEPQCASANGQLLAQVPGSPVISGSGAAAVLVDGSDSFLYVANVSAINPPPNTATTGNISGFNIDANTGALTVMAGSPFTASNGSSPTALAISPSGQYVYALTPGASFSIWCFAIDYPSGQLVATAGSPFSFAAGGLYALFDPSGTYLYVGSNTGIDAYTIDQSSGAPTAVTGSPFATKVATGKMVFLN